MNKPSKKKAGKHLRNSKLSSDPLSTYAHEVGSGKEGWREEAKKGGGRERERACTNKRFE